jgi:hypothetical protein
MQQQNIPIGTLVDMYKRGELRLPEIQRHYVWQGHPRTRPAGLALSRLSQRLHPHVGDRRA